MNEIKGALPLNTYQNKGEVFLNSYKGSHDTEYFKVDKSCS